MSALAATPPTMALGVVRKGKQDFRLAVRVQKRGLENSPQVESIKKKAKGEVNVRYIGEVTKRAAVPWYQKMTRPLRIGASIGHFKITAGTLGGFVRSRDDSTMLILSNNHVLANENKAKKGDAIIQPGPFDGGQDPRGKSATSFGSSGSRRPGRTWWMVPSPRSTAGSNSIIAP